jgi:hypothetical protein
MGEIDYLRESDGGAAAGPAADGESPSIKERRWPLSLSMVIAVVVSVILWAGIIVFAMRLWRWL